jgi:drug/metabolite transporter (DMT)-like permease|tara:strand:+ start:223 stop:1116 length:894 start_codon:yes stop_codon:yes gene_type:complete
MTFAIITAILFAFSAVFNTRITKLLDEVSANYYRLLIACLILGVLTAIFQPSSFHPLASSWLLLSGVVGFGLGDIALFAAFSRIGSRLTILINFSLSAIVGAFADWLVLDDAIGIWQWGSIIIILCGLGIALLSSKNPEIRQGSFRLGIIAALIAGVGQGIGASISRHAEKIADSSGIVINGVSQAFQRVSAGLFCLALVWLWKRARGKLSQPSSNKKTIAGWLILAAIFGPVLGVSCLQQSLKTLTSGEAMAVTATSPLLLIPLAYFFEGDRIRPLALSGAFLGVGGVIIMALTRT